MVNREPMVYLAGPLFNDSERKEMAAIAEALESAGILTFLPQRDGLRLTELFKAAVNRADDVTELVQVFKKIIFDLDAYEVVERCDGLVLNINGRVPDEGAVIEAAWAWLSGKPIVVFKDDERSLLNGLDNPLVTGLAASTLVNDIILIPRKMMDLLKETLTESLVLPNTIRETLVRGELISRKLESRADYGEIYELIKEIYLSEDAQYECEKNP